MLELENIEKRVLATLTICDYQFPQDLTDDWCLIKLRIVQDDSFFEKVDAALEAVEVDEIHRWFESLSKGLLPHAARLIFVEPAISFEYLSNRDGIIRFCMNLRDEFLPNFKLNQLGISSSNWSIVFGLTAAQLASIAANVEQAYMRFPTRSKKDNEDE